MDHKEAHHLRLYVLAALFFIVAAVYIGVLYDTQVNNYDYYYASSVRSIARSETVEAARGNITDRNGKVLVSSRSSYNLTFDASLLEKDEDANESLLRLLQLCQSRGINWVDSLPISRSAPFAYTIDSLDSAARSRFLTYLKDLDEAANALAAYLLEHPALLETTDEEGNRENPADDILADEELDQAGKAQALLEELTSSQLTGAMLEGSGLSATRLIALMRKDFGLSASFSVEEARLVLGVQYEIRSRNLARTDAYVLAEDIDAELISLLNDGDYAGAKITPSSVREYETTYGAHILGYLGKINDSAEKEALGEGYNWNDYVGKDGVEAAFESHLKGTDGTRVVSLNEDGKITGEYYSKEPVPGNTVELTIDLDLQQAAEDALAATITRMTGEDGDETRGGAVAVVQVGTGEVLALASYPTYDLSTFRQSSIYAALYNDPARPFTNRATNGTYVPGSTIKPLTAVAALEKGIITPTQEIYSPSRWVYPNDPTHSGANCAGGNHGLINVTEAITKSCNYFFAEMGYRMGMDTFREYLQAFGLGEHTGIEIGDYAGTLPSNEAGHDQTPWATFGQANQLYSPLQLANYIATLVNGGTHNEVHLLKAVKSYDNSQVLAVGGGSVIDTAKGVGIVTNNPEFADVKSLEGPADTHHRAVPTFALPTTAGTAAEVTINYVIIDEEARKKMVCVDPNDIPSVAIVDPELMYSMPKGLTAATGMDALTHAIEGYITKGAWTMSDMFELKAIELIARHLKAAVDDGKDAAAREGMSVAQYIAGMGFSNVGLGIVHSMAHPLGAFYDTPHGVANALLLPYVMEYNAASDAAPKYRDIARAMGVDTDGMSVEEGVAAAVKAVRDLSLSIGIPQQLHEIGVKEADIPALSVAAFNDVCTGGNPRDTSVAEIEALYRKAF